MQMDDESSNSQEPKVDIEKRKADALKKQISMYNV